jgi:hypothetical protein
MNDAWTWWLFLLGMGVGIAVTWLVIGGMRPGDTEAGPLDVGGDVEARMAEAGWIADVIASRGGFAPPPLVHEILDLHDEHEARMRS